MNPRINIGRGVTGAVRYVLGQGRDPKTGALKELMPGDDSRVEWIGGTGFGFKIETAADADLARRVMEFDALNQKSRTKQCELDCVHLSLSWRPGETPTREQMEEAARGALADLGMANAKAIFVSHSDEHYPHLHLIASKINPDTGRAYDLDRSYRKLSVWAQEYERENGGVISLRRQDANELRAAIARRDAEAVLDALTKQRATFTGTQLERALNKEIYAKRGATADEKLRVDQERAGFAASVINHPRAVHLAETKDGPTVRYTTREVIEAELHVLHAAERLALDTRHQLDDHKRAAVLQAERFKTITPEQAKAFHHATGAEGLTLIEGQAGTGKSFCIAAVRTAYEAAGYRVIGLGPTNSVAQDMKADGFSHAATIHSELFALNNDRTSWTQKTAVIVDEAAMLETGLMSMVTAHANDAGAKLILVGDGRQLSSISRGGLFDALKDRHGAAVLSEVQRQYKQDERRAAEIMATGNFHDALGIYQAKGAIHWTRTQREARAELVEQWAKDSSADPEKSRFVFAYTNQDVKLLNAALRSVRKGRGELGPDHMFETAHDRENFAVGDRIQFTKTDKKAGIFNGAAGTIEAIHGIHIAVRLDGRQPKTISFNAAAFNEFRHGYAGTIYRGQGRTLDQTMLYHSEHWRSAASYVALTRHRDKAELFVATNTARDVKELARQMARTDDRRAASQFYHQQDIQVRPLTPAEMLASFAAGIFRDRAETPKEPAAGEAKGNAQVTHLHAVRAAPRGGDDIPPRKDRKMEDERDSNPRRPANANNVGVTTSELAHGDSGLRRRPADLHPEPDFSKAAFDTTEPVAKLRQAWRQPEFSEATIAADPWTAVYLAIPEKTTPWLLLKAIDAVAECRDMIVRGPGTGPQLQQRDDGPVDNARQATERFHELSHRLEAALKPEVTPPSAPPPSTPQRANDNTRERMTVESIQEDPWKVLDRPLPADADRTLLAAVVLTADQCAKTAFAASRVAQIVEPELAGYYRDLQAEAAERSHEARQKLGRLPPEQVAKVSPFLHPDELHNTALVRMLNMGVDRQRAGERLWPLYISNEAMDKNPWAAAFSNIPEDASPELLRRTAQTAFGLIRQSLEHSQASYTREEADVWSGYAWVAIEAWNDAHSALRAAELEQIVTPAAEFSPDRSPPETRDEMLRRHTLEAELVHGGYHIEETPAQLAKRQTKELARFAAHETDIGAGIRAEIPAGARPTPGGLDAVEKQTGVRPEIVLEARQTPETEATPTAPAPAIAPTGGQERAATGEFFRDIESTRASELEGAVRGLMRRVARFSSRFLGRISDRIESAIQSFGDVVSPAPKMTRQQVHDMLQAHVGNLEKDHAQAVDAAQQEDVAAKAEQIFAADQQQQQADLSLAERFGRNATREVNVGRENDRQPDRDRDYELE